MNWDAIGAIGEVVGAAATVATLLYLAAQIRRANVLATAESGRYSQQAANPTLLAMVQDPDVARVFREGLRDRDGLSADDQIRFDMLMGTLFGAVSQNIVDQELMGHSGDIRAADQAHNVRAFLGTPGGASWWALYRNRFPTRVQAVFDDVLRTLVDRKQQ